MVTKDRTRSDNTSGVTGVYKCKKTNMWMASISTDNNKRKRLYYGPSFYQACVAREKAERELKKGDDK